MAKLEWRRSEQHPTCRDFVLEPESGRTVTGALWLPDGYRAGDPLALVGHGASGDRYQPPGTHFARRFASHGAATLALDGPVHGLRQVGPGGRAAFAREMQRPSFLDDMVADWDAALRVLGSEVGVGRGGNVYFGLSMGSIFGVPLLAARGDITAACLGLLGTSGTGALIGSRLRQDAAAIRAPILFLVQLEDELFPRDGCLDLFDHLASDTKCLHASPGTHAQVPLPELRAASDFVLRYLCEAA